MISIILKTFFAEKKMVNNPANLNVVVLADEDVKEFNNSVLRDEYYDILTTEDCFVDDDDDIPDNIILGYN